MSWLTKLGTLISQTINALIFQGHPDESLSARSFHERETSRFWAFIYSAANWIFGADHCYQAALSDKQFAEDALRRWS
jgi:hypothetical protein